MGHTKANHVISTGRQGITTVYRIVCWDDSNEYPQHRVWKETNGFRIHHSFWNSYVSRLISSFKFVPLLKRMSPHSYRLPIISKLKCDTDMARCCHFFCNPACIKNANLIPVKPRERGVNVLFFVYKPFIYSQTRIQLNLCKVKAFEYNIKYKTMWENDVMLVTTVFSKGCFPRSYLFGQGLKCNICHHLYRRIYFFQGQ